MPARSSINVSSLMRRKGKGRWAHGQNCSRRRKKEDLTLGTQHRRCSCHWLLVDLAGRVGKSTGNEMEEEIPNLFGGRWIRRRRRANRRWRHGHDAERATMAPLSALVSSWWILVAWSLFFFCFAGSRHRRALLAGPQNMKGIGCSLA
jgi:hypothetical protein